MKTKKCTIRPFDCSYYLHDGKCGLEDSENNCEYAFNKNVVDTIHYKIDLYNKKKAVYNEALGRVFDMYRKKLYSEIVEECDKKITLLNELIERKIVGMINEEISIEDKVKNSILFYNHQIELFQERYFQTKDKSCKKMFREVIKNCEIRIDTLSEITNSKFIEDIPKTNNLDYGYFLHKNFIVVEPGWRYVKDYKVYTTEEAYELFTSIAR